MGNGSAVTTLFVLLGCPPAGLRIIASGLLFLAVRKIVWNMRNEESAEISTYGILLTIALLNNLIGWLVIYSRLNRCGAPNSGKVGPLNGNRLLWLFVIPSG